MQKADLPAVARELLTARERRESEQLVADWEQETRRLGDALAMRNLGNLFEHGFGVTKNLDDARKWYEKAAIAGDEEAKKRLELLK